MSEPTKELQEWFDLIWAKDTKEYCGGCKVVPAGGTCSNPHPCETARAEISALISRADDVDRLVEAAKEVYEVATLRGDNDLPHPENDSKLWTARMQTAWDELANAFALFIKEKKK
jgi:hypothetical protein